MGKAIIAIDIDDVLAKGTESLRREVNRRLGVDLQPEHYSIPGEYWGYYERVWQENGLGGRITMEELNPQMVEDQSHVPPFDEARVVLRKLLQRYRLVVVTARNPDWRPATERWLQGHFSDVFEGIYFAGNHSSVQTKGELCMELGAEWLIDDNIGHAHTALECGINVVLFGDYGWHKGLEVHEDVARCKDWAAVGKYFDGIG